MDKNEERIKIRIKMKKDDKMDKNGKRMKRWIKMKKG